MSSISEPHPTSSCALPGETRNPEIASFHFHDAYSFAKKQAKRIPTRHVAS